MHPRTCAYLYKFLCGLAAVYTQTHKGTTKKNYEMVRTNLILFVKKLCVLS